jgi:subtilisin family serine protease
MSTPAPVPAGGRARRAAAAWALTVLALSAAVPSAAAVERSDSVLVRVDPASTPTERVALARALDADAMRPLVAGWRAYDLPEGVTLAEARRLLAGEDAAQSVQLDGRLFASEVPDDTHYGLQWALPRIAAPAAWDATGSAAEVVVAVIDTGVQTTHPDLQSRIWQNPGETPANGLDDDGNGRVDDVAGWNFHDETPVVYSAADGDSHGTHVAGTIAARRGNGAGVAGVADNVRIMPLKFLKPGGGYTSDAILAIQYAVAEGAGVINASWGGETYSQPLCDAIRLAGDAGVLVVVAAGNGGADGIGDDNDATPAWPANCPSANVVSVAATTTSDGLADFSNRGASSVDLGAPGQDVLSTIPGNAYGYKSGTSMAAPHVSGVAALVLGMHPGLAPWQVKAAITEGAAPVPALAGVTASGRRLDLAGALTLAGTGVGPDVTPPDPFAALGPADGLATAVPGPLLFSWTPSSDGGSGVASYRLVVGGATVATTAPSARSASAVVGDGAHTWTVAAQDASGNVRHTAPRALIVDRTAPTAPAARARRACPDPSWTSPGAPPRTPSPGSRRTACSSTVSRWRRRGPTSARPACGWAAAPTPGRWWPWTASATRRRARRGP